MHDCIINTPHRSSIRKMPDEANVAPLVSATIGRAGWNCDRIDIDIDAFSSLTLAVSRPVTIVDKTFLKPSNRRAFGPRQAYQRQRSPLLRWPAAFFLAAATYKHDAGPNESYIINTPSLAHRTRRPRLVLPYHDDDMPHDASDSRLST